MCVRIIFYPFIPRCCCCYSLFFRSLIFALYFFFVPSILLCVRAFSFALLPFPSRILFPLHFNVHFYCIYSACFFSCVPSLRRFIQLLLVSVYVYGLFSLLCRSLASFHNAKPLKCLSYIFFPHFYLDYRHVVWCSSVHFDYIYFKQKNCCSPNDIRVSVLVRWIFVPIEQDRKKIQNEIYRKSLKIRFCSATKSIAKLHEILFDSWLNAFRFYLPWILSNASKMCLQWPEKKLYDRFEYAYIKTY